MAKDRRGLAGRDAVSGSSIGKIKPGDYTRRRRPGCDIGRGFNSRRLHQPSHIKILANFNVLRLAGQLIGQIIYFYISEKKRLVRRSFSEGGKRKLKKRACPPKHLRQQIGKKETGLSAEAFAPADAKAEKKNNPPNFPCQLSGFPLVISTP